MLWAGGRDKNEILLDVGGSGVSENSGSPIFLFLLKKIGFTSWPGIMLVICTDKKSSFWVWCQTVKPSFNDPIVLFKG